MTDWQIKPSSGLLLGNSKSTSESRQLIPVEVISDDTSGLKAQRDLAIIVREVIAKMGVAHHNDMVEDRRNMVAIKSIPKEITVGGAKYAVDAPTLMRMIRQVTQTIGEYKVMNNIYSQYVVPALRKARSDMISDLEHHFHIKWELDVRGNSVFYT